MRNVLTASRHPGIALEYATWMLGRSVLPRGPVRNICGVTLGNFNSFSEYHSTAGGITAAELAFLDRHNFGDGAFLDIGANLGLFSLVLRRRFPTRRMIAFEPAPSTYQSLVKNARLNAAGNLECHQVAVSDRVGTASFAVREDARANSSLGGEPSSARIDIRCVSLDSFVADSGVDKIALLKVDVEGFEAAVFRGARQVLKSLRPGIVYFEVCPALARREGFAADEAAAILEDEGYTLHRIARDGSMVLAQRGEIEAVALENWIAVPR